MGETILVVAVHPDDETLGCGGTLLRHAAAGDTLHWLIVTAMTSPAFSAERIIRRNDEIGQVASAYGFAGIHQLGFATTRLDTIPDADMVAAMSAVFSTVKPSVVYLPFRGDVHSDHRKTFAAAYSCTKSFRHPYVRRVLMMEALSESEFAPALPGETFVPNVYRDIGTVLERKIDILRMYQDEVAPAPFPRSVETVRALATFRGAVAGCIAAEAFMLLKDVA